MESTTGPVHFLNLEYFFRLLYESRVGGPVVPSVDGIAAWIGHTWTIIGIISFVISFLGLLVLAYVTMRIFQIKQHEHHQYGTLDPVIAEKSKDHSRWAHVQNLIESAQENDWRQAVIEADIMLDEVLTQAGYPGDSVGDKLKTARFDTIERAWDAHKVRNDIAHQGSAYRLDDTIAYRAIKNYEAVFKEFGEI